MTLSAKISAAITALNHKKDELSVLVNKASDGEVVAVEVLEELNKGIQADQALITSMQASEQLLAKAAAPAFVKNVGTQGDYSFEKHAIATMKAKVEGTSVSQAAAVLYGETSAVVEVTKAATAPANTTVAAWAGDLIQQQYAGFQEALFGMAILPKLVAKGGMTLAFNGNSIIMPTRGAVGTLGGAFIGEGAAIPVKAGAFAQKTFNPYKMGVIAAFTKEIIARSNPQVEALVRKVIVEDTATVLDNAFLSAAAPVAGVSPGGALVAANMAVAAITSTGNTAAALMADIRTALTPILNANMGKALTVIMTPALHLQLSLVVNATGNYVFANELASGRLLGMDVIVSTHAPAQTLTIIEASEFGFGIGAPVFTSTDSASLQLDSAPVAQAFTSMFQTEQVALKLVMPVSWDSLRGGTVAQIVSIAA